MTSSKKPTQAEVAAAREVLTLVAAAEAEPARAAMIALVTMPEFSPVVDAARKAQTLNPIDTELSYALSMLERLRASHTPA